jgi:4-hydroxy-3-methylbut-2-enyl diphosphate reductase
MKVSIDPFAGFCFGVKRAIEIAEKELQQTDQLFCLGEIVHNEKEIQRLGKSGLLILDHKVLKESSGSKVLIRAHGEPPSTYKQALEDNIEIIDATCPVVLKIQEKVKTAWDEMKKVNGQIVIYGKKNHPEIIGLAGQTENNSIVIEDSGDLFKIDMSRPFRLFVQTTKNKEDYMAIIDLIKEKLKTVNPEFTDFIYYDNICGQVSQRIPKLEKFCLSNEVIIFVSGVNSSNGKQLYNICQNINPNSYFISSYEEVNNDWFFNIQTVGITGATSTPSWLMEKVAAHISKI